MEGFLFLNPMIQVEPIKKPIGTLAFGSADHWQLGVVHQPTELPRRDAQIPRSLRRAQKTRRD